MLNHLVERVRLRDRTVQWLGDEAQVAGPNAVDRADHLVEFKLDLGLPVWLYELPGVQIEKRYQGLETPAKLKLATAGCPRNCSEATTKDVGVILKESSFLTAKTSAMAATIASVEGRTRNGR